MSFESLDNSTVQERDQRAHPRVPCDIETERGKITDISCGGVHLQSRRIYVVDDSISLKFPIPTTGESINLDGVICRKHETPIQSLSGYGIKFDTSSEEEATRLSLFINSRKTLQNKFSRLIKKKEASEPRAVIPRHKKNVQLRDVVITGIGVLNAIGNNTEEYWKNLLAGKVGIKQIDDPFVEGSKYYLAPIEGFDLNNYQDDKYYFRLRNLKTARQKCYIGREIDLQLASIGMALKDGGLDYDREFNKIGVVLGFETCGFSATEHGYVDLVNQARQSLDLSTKEVIMQFFQGHMLSYMNSCSFSNVYYATAAFGLHGSSASVNTASASGMVALHQAIAGVQMGDTDVMLAGASEDLIDSSLRYHIFKRLGVHSDDAYILPWDVDRHGSIMGEAAITLMVEEKEHALKRGAHIYAEIKASSVTQDGHHILSPDSNVRYLTQAYDDACGKAGVAPDEVDFVLPHSTGTKMNDQIQTDAIRMSFPHDPYVASFSPQVGHPLCASGLLRVITAALALRDQVIPPTVATRNIEADCAVKLVNQPTKTQIRNVACSAISYGGTNVGMIISKPD